MTGSLSCWLADEAATKLFAAKLAAALPADTAGWILLLEGELGAGKSTFARGFLEALGQAGAIPSPTYTLVEPYQIAGRRIYHIDLYRLSAANELDFLGFSEFDDGLCLIEWPDRAPALAEQADLRIGLQYGEEGVDDQRGRVAALTASSERGRLIVAALVAGRNLAH